MKNNKETLLLVDGNALVHRGFHAIPHLSNKKGEPTNGVYGFALLLLNALKELKPDYAAVTFDLAGPTFRDEIYKKYKAGRVKAPDELYQQIPRVKELVEAFNIPIYEKAGFEADDVIGTLATQADKENLQTIILTGDYDTLQLVNHSIKVFAPQKGLSEAKMYGAKEVQEKYGLTPEQMVDFRALRGDPSDNIPGVPGIGQKTASELLQKFGTLEKIYEYLDTIPSPLSPPTGGEGKGGGEIKPRIASLLLEHKADAQLSRKLSEIVRDAPVKLDIQRALLHDFDEQKVVKLFQELEFKSLLSKIPLPQSLPPGEGKEKGEYSSPHRGGDKVGGYHLVDTKDKLEKFLLQLKKQKEIVIDTETTSLHSVESELVGIGFGFKKGEAHYLPAKYRNIEISRILADPKVKKIGHNIKYDYLALKVAGIKLSGIAFDTMIAAYLLNPGARAFDLDTLAFTEFGFRKTPIESLIGKGKEQITMAEAPVAKVADYCCEDVDYTFRLKEKLEKELTPKLRKIFEEIEMPLAVVLAEMEYQGIRLDAEVLEKLSKEGRAEIAKLEKKIYKLAGKEFNIGSPIQLKEILFERLHIPTEELKKGKTGLSTAATELEKLRGLHPIIELLFEWRELTKLENTYLDALPKLVNPATGRVHTSFNQTIAATGRLSSSDPNLQNIPIRTALGRKVRRAFIAAKHYKLVAADYSQIELRVAAHLSGDKKMIKVFREGGDIHEATARAIGVDRRAAKVINFGVLYGLSAYGLTSRIPGVSREEAHKFIEKYKAAYTTLWEYLEDVIDKTRQKGFVENELGRIRKLPEINSSQFQVRSAAERAALNMPLQSLAADIIKMAMNKLAERDLTSGRDCRLLLQVHDELVFEIAENKVKEFVPQILKIMEGVYKLKVLLVASAKVGDNWEKMQKIS